MIFLVLCEIRTEQLPESPNAKTGLLLSLLIFEAGDNIYSLPLQPKGGAEHFLSSMWSCTDLIHNQTPLGTGIHARRVIFKVLSGLGTLGVYRLKTKKMPIC